MTGEQKNGQKEDSIMFLEKEKLPKMKDRLYQTMVEHKEKVD